MSFDDFTVMKHRSHGAVSVRAKVQKVQKVQKMQKVRANKVLHGSSAMRVCRRRCPW